MNAIVLKAWLLPLAAAGIVALSLVVAQPPSVSMAAVLASDNFDQPVVSPGINDHPNPPFDPSGMIEFAFFSPSQGCSQLQQGNPPSL